MGKNFGWTRRAGRAAVVCGMVGGTLAALTPLAQATASGTLYVNAGTGSDTGTCRLIADPCQTISYALTKAPAGATIKVAAGAYPEPLKITQAVTIIGAGSSAATGTVIDPATLISDTDTDSSTPQDTVIDIPSATGVTLKNIDVDGQDAEGNFDGCGADFVGVYYHDSSGTMTGVQVDNIQLAPDLFGCQDGQGVYVTSDAGDTSSVTMTRLNVNAYDKNGVTCDDAGTTCTLTSSKITGIGATSLIAQNGFQGYNAASVTLTSDTIKGNSYSGGGAGNSACGVLIYDVGSVSLTSSTVTASDVNIYLGDDGTGPAAGTWTVNGNTVSKGTDNVNGGEQGYGDGIDLDSTSNPVTISDNTVMTDAEYGIALTGASNATVTGNTVNRNTSDGIYVGGPGSVINTSSGDTISDNISSSNKGDGILADGNSANNVFAGNTVAQNVAYDLEDQGSGNTWPGNTCRPAHDSNPAGLC